MGLFSKQVLVLKDSLTDREYLSSLEELKKNNDSDLLEKEIATTKAGIAGEDNIMFELKNSGMDLVVLHDVYIEAPNGNGAQVDFIVITPYVNVFIECKNLFGNIEINNKGDFIRTFSVGKRKYREGLYSPITQNARHLEIYKEIRLDQKNLFMKAGVNHWFADFHKSLVVLANQKTVIDDRFAPRAVKEQVIRADQLITTLKSYKSDDKSSFKHMTEIGNKILSVSKERDINPARIARLKGKMASEQNKSEQKEVCPLCGGQLVVRNGRYGKFYGCSNYPRCRFTKALDEI